MQFSKLFVATFAAAAGTPLANALGCTRMSNPGEVLADWFTNCVYGFFPYVDGWQNAYDQCFDLNVIATFNATEYDFQSFKELYSQIQVSLNERMGLTFSHDFISVVATPNPKDLGGFVTATGWEGGMMDGTDWFYNATDAAYAVITEQPDCSLKITEFRETSNLGFGTAE